MSALLTGNLFDAFLLQQATLETAQAFQIDGRLHRSFYDDTDMPAHNYEHTPWADMRPVILSLIRGKHTPLSFRFVLQYMPDAASELAPDTDLVLIISFRTAEGVTLTTGTSPHTFTMDKSGEQNWDQYLQEFLNKNNIAAEEL